MIIGKVSGWWGKGIKEDTNTPSVTTQAPVEETPEVTDEPQVGMVDVPNISNRTLEEAQEILEEKNLNGDLSRLNPMRHQILFWSRIRRLEAVLKNIRVLQSNTARETAE